MSANTEKRRHSLANFKIDDPGASGTISGRNSGYVDIVTAGAESRTVDTPVRGGLELTLNGKTLAGAATIAVTNYIGSDDSLVLSANGDCIVLKSVDVNGTLTWKQVGGTKWETATATTVSATTVSATTLAAGAGATLTSSGLSLAVDEPATITYESYGAQTQASSITTTVVLNSVAGIITTVSSTLAADARAQFTVTNSAVAADSIIICTAKTGGAGTPVAYASNPGAGSFTMVLENKHASAALDNTVLINFAVIALGTAA